MVFVFQNKKNQRPTLKSAATVYPKGAPFDLIYSQIKKMAKSITSFGICLKLIGLERQLQRKNVFHD
jgi:hypothetical protein